MSKFRPLATFEDTLKSGYRLLPFRFTELGLDKYVASNMAGEYVVLSRSDLQRVIDGTLAYDSELYRALKAHHFIMDQDSSVAVDLLALKVRTKAYRIAEFTGLHMFVTTLRCEHSCPYCQVSRRSDDRTAFDMTRATADRALDLVFKSPSQNLKIEFQGGESILNFDLVRHIVQRAREINVSKQRNLGFVIATNLALVDDEILRFCRDNMIQISTSLDGPADLHNANRPRPGGDSHERAVGGIKRARAIVGRENVSALMTTTALSLTRARDIIDEYLGLEFGGIFLRPLSPYGFAVKTKAYASYNSDEWLKFYIDGLNYILEINRLGHRFVEHYASLILTKMLTPFDTGYVDLRSPAAIGIGAIVYNYDGDVYASDEGRMLSEMGDFTFRLGNVYQNSWEQIVTSEALLDPLEASFAASAPMCCDCAFEPYCGADPVFHHATQGDSVGHKPTSRFCDRNMAIFRHLITLMDDPETRMILRSWTYS